MCNAICHIDMCHIYKIHYAIDEDQSYNRLYTYIRYVHTTRETHFHNIILLKDRGILYIYRIHSTLSHTQIHTSLKLYIIFYTHMM